MHSFARVVPELSLDRAFDYSIPSELRSTLQLGSKVKVPFGSRELVGYVIAFPEKAEVAKIKPVLEIIGERPIIPEASIRLAQWMADYYGAPLGVVLRCILPESVRRAESGYKERLWVEPRVSVPTDEAEKILGKAKSQKLAWEFLHREGGGWLTDLCNSTRTTRAVWKGLEDKGLINIRSAAQERDPWLGEQEPSPTSDLLLNDEQRVALTKIEEQGAAEKPGVVLLHGVTGSGKTEVYLQAIASVLARQKSALVLVPEIALTPQTVDRFRARFLGQKIRIAVLHSHLSVGERHDQWQEINSGRARIVIGARSAVFAPLHDLGLIVVDEEHETSYKQEDSPHYNARDLAVMRGHLQKVPVVLGSATPSLESFQNARDGKYQLCSLKQRVESQRLPIIHVIDMRQEFKKQKKAALLSERLIEAIEKRIAAEQQTIIFLNRRGFATSLQCPSCARVEECPNCSLPLTYHRRAGRLRCHLCDHAQAVPERCPTCGFDNYKYSGIGTEKVEDHLAHLFPKARVVRMDSDTMRGKDMYRKTLGDMAAGKIDILVGTQMIAKGLHFPNVTCVGVVNADLALQLPDFRASERVFQVLMQVSGRAGRGDFEGEVFVQTATPFHPAIQFARHHDYDGFADQELEFRRELGYPPFQRAVLVTWRGRDEEKTIYVAEQTAKKIKAKLPSSASLSGPAPAPIAKINNFYRYHLFFKTQNVPALMRVLRPEFIDAEWPDGIQSSLDVDPMFLL